MTSRAFAVEFVDLVRGRAAPGLRRRSYLRLVDAAAEAAYLITPDVAARILDAHGELVVQLERSKLITPRTEGILCSA
jgi:hypothetical protein